jgi:hypothetical protein
MDYSRMVENALRGVVRAALEKAATDGLHGNHHFYVTFLTGYEGVELPEHLLERYPSDITIVLQHQFWDMEVGDEAFEVSLSFNKMPTRIRVPYLAITSFADPSVQFGLQFQPPGMEDLAPGGEQFPVPSDDDAERGGDAASGDPEPAAEAEPQGEVVSLDAFRKKN